MHEMDAIERAKIQERTVCPEFNKKAEIWAEYEGKLMNKDDIILTYCLRSYSCNLINPEERCPHIGLCPFIEERRYY